VWAETWVLSKTDELRLGVVERQILRRIYGPVCEGAIWRSRCNEELYRLYDETDLVTSIRLTKLRWAGHIVRMQDNLPCKKITLDKPEGRRRVGRPNLRWMDGWSDGGCGEVGSQKLEDQGQGQRWLEAITRVGQDPAWAVAPRWMDGWMDGHIICVRL
jgi:hypothetical protein